MTPFRPAVQVAAHLVFGSQGNAEPHQMEGWSRLEPDFAWSIGPASRLHIPYQPGQGTLMLEISLRPNLAPPMVREARLTVTANGALLCDEEIAGETTLGFVVPASSLGDSGRLLVQLGHPDAFAPASLNLNSDQRQLGFAVRDVLLLWVPPEAPFTRRTRPPLPAAPGGLEAAVRFCTALPPADLMHHFESLGHNCEFGFAQRGVGAEPLGLLRFGGISMPSLLHGLDYAFEGIEERSRLRAYTERGHRGEEYYVRDDRYGVAIHSQQLLGDTTPEALVEKFASHLAFLRRQFQDVLETGSRIFVLKDAAIRTQAQVLPILNLLRSHGPNVLLYVTEDVVTREGTVESGPPPGTVEQERADLFHGYIDQFALIYAADKPNVDAWVNICANTYRMWREQGGGGAN